MDENKLNELLGRFVGDLGATISAGNVVIGHRLGLYKAMVDNPGTADDLARRTRCDPRYVAEWLRGQAAGGYVDYDADTDTYSIGEEQAFVLANPDGAVYAPGAFVLALGSMRAMTGSPRRSAPVRASAGTSTTTRCSSAASSSSGRVRRQPGAELDPGARRRRGEAHGGRDRGRRRLRSRRSTILLAQHYPNSEIHGFDYHDESIELAHKRAADAGVADRIHFDVAPAQNFPGPATTW